MTLNSNCWEWTRYREGGYGRLKRNGWFMVVCCAVSLGFLIYIVNGACN